VRDDLSLIDFIRALALDIGGGHGRHLFTEEAGAVGQRVATMVNGPHTITCLTGSIPAKRPGWGRDRCSWSRGVKGSY